MNQEEEIRWDSRSKGLSSGFSSHSDLDSTVEPKLESSVLSSQDVDIRYLTSPVVCRSSYTSKDHNRLYPKRDQSTVEKIIDWLCSLIFASSVILTGLSNLVPDYNTISAVLLTAEFCIRPIRKFYRVLSGFDDVKGLFDDYNVGALGMFLALWTNQHEHVIRILNLSYVGSRVIVYVIQVRPHSKIKLLIGRIFLKFVRVKNRRDRYEDLGVAGLLPSNEAVNKTTETPTDFWYYSLEKIQIHRAKPCNEAIPNSTEGNTDRWNNSTKEVVWETCPGDISDHNVAKAIEVKKISWKIGTMLVSYSDNYECVTIMQKAEDRALKTYEESFTEQQKCNFIQIMKAWEDRPEQGILGKVLADKINWHCLTLSQVIDLAKQGYSLCKVKTDLASIRGGAEVDAIIEECIDSIYELVYKLAMAPICKKVCMRGMQVAWMLFYLCVAILSVIVMLIGFGMQVYLLVAVLSVIVLLTRL